MSLATLRQRINAYLGLPTYPPDPQVVVRRLPSGSVFVGMDVPRGNHRMVTLPEANASGVRLESTLRVGDCAGYARTLREAAAKLEGMG